MITKNTLVGNCSLSLLGVEVSRFKSALGKAIEDLESVSLREFMTVEFKMLVRIIYRTKQKFRNDNGLKHMLKLRTVLRNVRNMFLEKDYTILRSDLRMEDGVHILPSRQRLEYVLVRTQGYSKLMTKIRDISMVAAHFWKSRTQLGHAWPVSTIAYSIASRFWYCLYK